MLGIKNWHLDSEKMSTADGITERADAVVQAKVSGVPSGRINKF